MRPPLLRVSTSLATALWFAVAGAQSPPTQSQSPPPQASTLAPKPGARVITLSDAIQMALDAQSQSAGHANYDSAESSGGRSPPICGPIRCLSGTRSFCRSSNPASFSSDYIDNSAQFDLGVSYLFERGKKRQHRLQAAKDVTAQTRSQVVRQRAHADLQRCLAIHQRRAR